MKKPKPIVVDTPKAKRTPLSKSDWETIKALYCNGERGEVLAARFGISASTIHARASKSLWPTPGRIRRSSGNFLVSDDPAAAVADLWVRRKAEGREELYVGASRALQRFWAMSPVPASFQEAAIAQKLQDEALNPDKSNNTKGNVNIAFMSGGFKPTRVQPPIEVKTT